MSESPLLVSDENRILTLTLNRPQKRNALTREILEQLVQTLQKYRDLESIRLVILQGAGSVFCAGMDLTEMQETANSPDAQLLWQRDAECYAEVLSQLIEFPAPALAILQGPVLAGGVGLGLACDLVMGTPSTTFSLPEPQRGIVASVVTPLLHHRVGAGIASWLLLSQTPCTAEQAAGWGLIHQLVLESELESEREKLVSSILSAAPHALRLTKQHLGKIGDPDLAEKLRGAARLSAELRGSAEAAEGLSAFREKRPPRWN